jgi:hypothetical protein
MRRRVSLFMLLLAMTATILVYGQGEKKARTEEDYQRRNLHDLSNLYPPSMAQELKKRTDQELREMALVAHSDPLPSRVKADYVRTVRPINELKKSLLVSWAKGEVPEINTADYQTEMLFTDKGEGYWLVVRQQDLLKFQGLKTGDPVELLVIKVGNVRLDRKDEQMEPVIVVEKYLKQ